tara:strand:+ start:290 stop:1987 length:1698 start_codon:yes stop_codon:yes gene_type:complete
MKNQMDGGEAILQAFRSLGVKYIISSPGSEWGAVWESLTRQHLNNGAGPKYLSCAHETLAVNIATGYTTITGRMQVVMLHTGVGLLQGAMGIDGALRQGVPMLLVSGQSLSFGDDPDFDPGPQWQSLLGVVGGPQRLIEPIVKWSSQAGSISTIFQQIVSAGEMAQRNPAGPVYMSIPVETMNQPWNLPLEFRKVPLAPKTNAEQSGIKEVADMLISSQNPAIVTELSGYDPAAYSALIELAEILSIPVVESRWSMFSNFPKEHPLHQGFGRPSIIDDADLLLMVCCTAPWYPPSNAPKNTRLVAIDETPFRPAVAYQPNSAEFYLEGDTATTLGLLVEAIRMNGVDKNMVLARHANCKISHDERVSIESSNAETAGLKSTISPISLCTELSKSAPSNTIYIDETITHRGAVLSHLKYSGPLSYIRAHGGLGQGLGIALGAKLAAPERTVISIMGDGTFMYNPVLQSLAFSKHEGLPILIVIFNNNGYAAMRENQRDYYPDGFGATNDIWQGHPLTDFNYEELAHMFGFFGARVEKITDLPKILEQAHKSVSNGYTAILNVLLDM